MAIQASDWPMQLACFVEWGKQSIARQPYANMQRCNKCNNSSSQDAQMLYLSQFILCLSFYVYHKVTNISNKDYMGNSKNISKMKVELGIFVFYSDAFLTELTWNFL